MPALATCEAFLDCVARSGLVEPSRLASFLDALRDAGRLPPGPKKLAGALVREGILTTFQAAQLLHGKCKSFVIAGKYKVLERLGAGGMGSVYLCEHLAMRRRVAVKVLPRSQAEDPVALQRFHREARAAASLDHPNIVRAFDIDREGRLHFIVMEYVEGRSFQDIVSTRGPLTIERAAHYIAQAADGLQYVHEAGLVHRDVKPGNLLLDRNGVVKLLDMGLARFFHDDSDDLTRKHQSKSVLGTADYLAPEQALDSHNADIRSDVYSLGFTLYFLLTGASPFAAAKSMALKLMWHQTLQPTPIRQVRPEIPEKLAAVVARMTAKDPAQRSQKPAEVVAALAPWTRTPIPPPLPEEMPELCPASRGTDSTMSARLSTAIAHSQPSGSPGSTVRLSTGSGPNVRPGKTPPPLSAPPPLPTAAPVRPRRGGLFWALVATVLGLLAAGGSVAWVLTRPAAEPTTSRTGATQQP
jgi:serine/threonine protein kinase